LILVCIGVLFVVCTAQREAPAARSSDTDVGILSDDVNVATAAALADSGVVLLVDVREQWEYDQGHIPGVRLIPLARLQTHYQEIPKDTTVILTCRSGRRSGRAAKFLREQGYDMVHNMKGGILAWQQAGYGIESE
jgi:rhodanese-related sulfurtransferase